ncbi:MAG TPA: RNA repair domain-containing protein [archaeon]|nr:RNA repair domain-containing protein [archaeon]
MNQLFKSDHPRDMLNEIKWKGFDLGRCEIYYIHRGAPNNTKIISGSSIKTIGRSFFETSEGTSIPYHRIFRIDFDGKCIYKRRIDR